MSTIPRARPVRNESNAVATKSPIEHHALLNVPDVKGSRDSHGLREALPAQRLPAFLPELLLERRVA